MTEQKSLNQSIQEIRELLSPEQFDALIKVVLDENLSIVSLIEFGNEHNLSDNGTWEKFHVILLTEAFLSEDESWKKAFTM